MAFSTGRNTGELNGTSVVTLVPTPAVSVGRMVRSMYIHNKSGVSVTVTVQHNDGVNPREIVVVTLSAGDTLEFGDGDISVLENGDTIEAFLGSSPGTNPSFVASWGDNS